MSNLVLVFTFIICLINLVLNIISCIGSTKINKRIIESNKKDNNIASYNYDDYKIKQLYTKRKGD